MSDFTSSSMVSTMLRSSDEIGASCASKFGQRPTKSRTNRNARRISITSTTGGQNLSIRMSYLSRDAKCAELYCFPVVINHISHSQEWHQTTYPRTIYAPNKKSSIRL